MGFFACYLLTPVTPPQRLRCTYVGFTVSPTRRIRQHNGELVNGAKRTTKHRPWEMIVVVHGFPSKFHALQFEYAWQHPYNCRFTKARLVPLKGTKGLGHPRSVKRKLIELHEMLHVTPWTAFPLTVTYTNATIQNLVCTSPFYQWPTHMTCEVRPLQEFADCQATDAQATQDEDDENQRQSQTGSACCICDDSLSKSDLQVLRCYHADCHTRFHALCLADHFLLEASLFSENGNVNDEEVQELRPKKGYCPECSGELLWPLVVRDAATKPKTVKKTKRDPSKKRPRAEEEAITSFGHELDKSTERNGGDGSADSDDCSNAGWFEDNAFEVEVWDTVEFATEASEPSVSTISVSPRHTQRQLAERRPPTVVDLTMIND